jgi:hypothetical protein
MLSPRSQGGLKYEHWSLVDLRWVYDCCFFSLRRACACAKQLRLHRKSSCLSGNPAGSHLLCWVLRPLKFYKQLVISDSMR